MKVRLQKALAAAGICSRRQAERLIDLGEVSVGGETVRRLGTKVDPVHERIEVRGRRVGARRPLLYIALNKPRGSVTTTKDPEGRPTVLDLTAGIKERLFPVGRLDYKAEGLLIMTNDGELAYSMTRPGAVAKTYRVKVKGTPSLETPERLRRGLTLEGERLLPAKVRLERKGETAWLMLTLHEGRNNQIVRMMRAVGHPVRRLRRVSVGPVQLGTLPTGRWRVLLPEEILALQRAAGRGTGRSKGAAFARTDARRRGARGPAHGRGRERHAAASPI